MREILFTKIRNSADNEKVFPHPSFARASQMPPICKRERPMCRSFPAFFRIIALCNTPGEGFYPVGKSYAIHIEAEKLYFYCR
jgi:hypothetical protein